MAKTALVVGASVAGTRVATDLRRLGYPGTVVLVDAQSEFPYDRPPLSKAMLTGADDAPVILLTAEDAAKHGIDLLLGVGAEALDVAKSRVTLLDGKELHFDDLVIATGARARAAPWPSHRRVLELRTLADGRRLREALRSSRSVAIIGAGFIGAEVASAARSLGLDVAIIDPLPIPMARLFGDEVGALFSQLHVANGVTTHFGVGVASVDPHDSEATVILADHTVLTVDLVVVGIGVLPNDDWLLSSGLVLDNGVVCDSSCRAVGRTNIYAAGDVARWHHPRHGEPTRVEHWTNAVEQAQFVAKAISSPHDVSEFAPVEYVWSDQYDWKIQIAGSPQHGVDHVVLSDSDQHRVCALWSDSEGAVVGGLTVNWPKAAILTRRAVASGKLADDLHTSLRSQGRSPEREADLSRVGQARDTP